MPLAEIEEYIYRICDCKTGKIKRRAFDLSGLTGEVETTCPECNGTTRVLWGYMTKELDT